MSAAFEDEPFDDSVRFVHVRGELDIATAPELRRRVDAALADRRPGLIVDLTEVTHLDSSGIAELIAAHQRATEAGRRLVLIVASEVLRRTLEIRGLSGFLTVADGRESALAELRGA